MALLDDIKTALDGVTAESSEADIKAAMLKSIGVKEPESGPDLTALASKKYNEGVSKVVKDFAAAFGIEGAEDSAALVAAIQGKITTQTDEKKTTSTELETLKTDFENKLKIFTADLDKTRTSEQQKDVELRVLKSANEAGLTVTNPEYLLYTVNQKYKFDADNPGKVMHKDGVTVINSEAKDVTLTDILKSMQIDEKTTNLFGKKEKVSSTGDPVAMTNDQIKAKLGSRETWTKAKAAGMERDLENASIEETPAILDKIEAVTA